MNPLPCDDIGVDSMKLIAFLKEIDSTYSFDLGASVKSYHTNRHAASVVLFLNQLLGTNRTVVATAFCIEL